MPVVPCARLLTPRVHLVPMMWVFLLQYANCMLCHFVLLVY